MRDVAVKLITECAYGKIEMLLSTDKSVFFEDILGVFGRNKNVYKRLSETAACEKGMAAS